MLSVEQTKLTELQAEKRRLPDNMQPKVMPPALEQPNKTERLQSKR